MSFQVFSVYICWTSVKEDTRKRCGGCGRKKGKRTEELISSTGRSNARLSCRFLSSDKSRVVNNIESTEREGKALRLFSTFFLVLFSLLSFLRPNRLRRVRFRLFHNIFYNPLSARLWWRSQIHRSNGCSNILVCQGTNNDSCCFYIFLHFSVCDIEA